MIYTSITWCLALFTGYEKDAWDEEESELEMGSVKKPKQTIPEKDDTDDDEGDIEHVGENVPQSQNNSIAEIKKDIVSDSENPVISKTET